MVAPDLQGFGLVAVCGPKTLQDGSSKWIVNMLSRPFQTEGRNTMSDPITALATANTGAMPTVYSSMKADTMQEKAERFNAISDPKHRIGDMINQVIWVKDVFVEIIELARTDDKGNAILDETGATIMDTAPRIVLIDKDGDTYQAVAMSVLNQLKRLFNDFGEPTWEPAIPIEVKQRSIGTNRVYTFVVRGDLMQ